MKKIPIAIIGKGCVYPDANSPEELCQNLIQQKVSIYDATESDWNISLEDILEENNNHVGKSKHTKRGTIQHFIPAYPKDDGDFQEFDKLGNIFQWSLHAVYQALNEAGLAHERGLSKCGIIMGNLLYPTREYSDYLSETLLGDHLKEQFYVAPENRFMANLPAQKIAQLFGMKQKCFALDAACASSLYAVKYACDELQKGRADLMIAAGVCASDELFLNSGFSSLGALSPTGQSRPFHKEADGLIPSQGAGALLLKRLDDALADGDHVLGVIKGVGLSNDGRSGGFLAPSSEGQVRAIREALHNSGISHDEVTFVECHATGTGKGDATELQSLEEVYGASKLLHIGSIKANLGHLLASSGIAGIIKVLYGFEKQLLAGTPGVSQQTSILEKQGYTIHQEAHKWEVPKKVAAISNFGFGGNNAHVILEACNEAHLVKEIPHPPAKKERVAIVGIDLLSDSYASIQDAYNGKTKDNKLSQVSFEITQLAFPPKDLQQCQNQQLFSYYSVQKLLSDHKVKKEHTGVFVGINSLEGACYEAFKARLPHLLKEGVPDDKIQNIRQSIPSQLTPGLVFGTMPNLPANRLNVAYDFKGESFSVAAGEYSGNYALEIAIEAIQENRLTTAIVVAADSAETSLVKALKALGIDELPETGVVSLLLKSEKQAKEDGDDVLSWIDISPSRVEEGNNKMVATKGLMEVALAAYDLPKVKDMGDLVEVKEKYKQVSSLLLTAPDRPIDHLDAPKLYLFSGSNPEELIQHVEVRNTAETHLEHKLVIVSCESEIDKDIHDFLHSTKSTTLTSGWITDKVYYRAADAITGDVAFVYTGAASSYKGMGVELFKTFPSLFSRLDNVSSDYLRLALDWIINEEDEASPKMKLISGSLLAQLHTQLTTNVFNIKPAVAFGLSAGETNCLIALDVIQDHEQLVDDLLQAEFYQKHLAIDFEAIQATWNTQDKINWSQWLIIGDQQAFLKACEATDKIDVTIIHTDNNFVISGDTEECMNLINQLNPTFSSQIEFDFAIHTPMVKPVEKKWRQVHTRKIKSRKDIRFYSEYFGGEYALTKKNVADALTFMGMNRLDFRKLVNKAWDDGVRVFIEHGPKNSMGHFIGEILKDKPHEVVSLDTINESSVVQCLKSAAALWAMDLATIPQSFKGKMKSKLPSVEFNVAPDNIDISEWLKKEFNYEDSHSMTPVKASDYLQFHFEEFLFTEEQNTDYTMQKLIEEQPLIQKQPQPFSYQTDVQSWHYQMVTENRRSFVHMMSNAQKNYLNTMAQLSNVITKDSDAYRQQEVAAQDMLTPLLDMPETLHAPQTSVNHDSQVPLQEEQTPGTLPGPKFDRAQLEELASGKISNVFGSLFEQQDHYAIQVRMPEPPLLLCDRVTGIEGEAGSMSTGTMWTESDVLENSWYLYNNRMPAGIFIESGQADLLLVSWMGVDFHQNKGERAYRLLGCELTFHGEMPQPGETLQYEIHLDGYANMGDVSLFFFHYDCHINGELRASVRNGQAGFFTKKELAESSGVIWTPEEANYTASIQEVDYQNATQKTSFHLSDIEAYQKGDMISCFGEEFYMTQPHTRTPRAASDQMNFIQTVPELNFEGGPKGRGYLKSEWQVSSDDWFFKGHFKNDECMPGTLMADACLQMMAFYMVAAGFTQNKDGWRFQPVPNESCQFICRGQVTPQSKKITYEIFVDEIIEGPMPTIYAHVLATVDDSLKIFMCERLPLQLVPDFPINTMQELLVPQVVNQKETASLQGFKFDYQSLINCALGHPKYAFGAIYEDMDPTIPSPRLPSPPYHFMSRITSFDGKPGEYNINPTLKVEYDIPEDAWYFKDNLNGVMPYSVLMEVALQPCGWLSTISTIHETKNKHVVFRNLDGDAVQHFDITPAHKVIETTTQLVSTSLLGETIILKFEVSCRVDGELFYELETVFGFFSPETMLDQKGHSIGKEENANMMLPANVLKKYKGGNANEVSYLPATDKLLMIDRMVYYEEEGGEFGKGYVRGEKDVKPTDWYFKAHFYSDPVQPGSLGVEALIQLIQGYLLHTNPDKNMEALSFEPIVLQGQTKWHYRGQVVPKNKLVIVDFDVEEIEKTDTYIKVIGHGRLWVNGLKIYDCPKIGSVLHFK